MTAVQQVRTLDTPSLLRVGVLGLALLGIVGTTIELVFLKHWDGVTQKIVWPALVALIVAFVLIARRPSRRTVNAARALALVVGLIAVVGIGLHIHENLEAGPLDRDYAATWDTMSAPSQWWAAITGDVGPAPTLAPGTLLQISGLLLLATVRLPLSPRDER